MSHTPGPWFIWKELALQREDMEQDEITDELLYESEFGVYAGNPDECTRGSLRGHSAHICDIDTDDFDYDDDEDKAKATHLANARLIAAAPELLEALKRLVGEVKSPTQEINKLGAVMQACAAISKATGEQA